ncbi:MAG: four helix bundle protein [Flavobacteriales bacterium]|nr:four helix bundle protein [Flavobacteriales bacterium]
MEEENTGLKTFEDLECWQVCTELRRFVSDLTRNFPADEQNGLTDQIRRTSRSCTDKIAEGYGRYNHQENIQFCRYSRGYMFELLNQLITAKDENYITEEDLDTAKKLIESGLALINGYINYLIKTKKQKRQTVSSYSNY